jgi:Undecaprenyl-phosphate glucose phosphotransferase
MNIWSHPVAGGDPAPQTMSYPSSRQPRFSVSVFKDLVQFGDGVLLLAVGALIYWVIQPRIEAQWFAPPFGEHLVATVIATAVALHRLRRGSLYALERLPQVGQLLTGGLRALLPGAVAGAACLLVLRLPAAEAGFWAAKWTSFGTLGFILYRVGIAVSMRGWLQAGRLDQNVAVVGTGELSAAFIKSVQSDKQSRTRVLGCYSAIPLELASAGRPGDAAGAEVRGDLDTLMLDCRLHRVDAIAIALPAAQADQIRQVVGKVRSCLADVFIVSDLCRLHLGEALPSNLDIGPVVSVLERPLRDWDLVQKAVFDRVTAVLLLILLFPLLCLVAALIRIEGPGPILFRQMRMGLNNNLFRIYKFRTMHAHMTDRLSFRQTSRSDPRVTRVGRVIRKLSIDELPQLINVLLGDMSLVGPRPHAPGTRLGDRKVDLVVATYAQRHRVKPGITGLAQIKGYRGEMTTEEQVIERVRYDLEYIENWSIWLDIKIMFWTVVRETRSRNAY